MVGRDRKILKECFRHLKKKCISKPNFYYRWRAGLASTTSRSSIRTIMQRNLPSPCGPVNFFFNKTKQNPSGCLYFKCSYCVVGFAHFFIFSGFPPFFFLSLCLVSFWNLVLDRPISQMSFLEQFLKESSIRGRAASADSEEGDIEDNRAPSVLSSSNKSASDLSSPVQSGPSHHISPLQPGQQRQTDGGNGGSPFGHRSMDRSSGYIMQVCYT